MEKEDVIAKLTEKGIDFDPEASVEDLTALIPQDDDDDKDYRSKLNAQNRFLEKEGYEFKDGKWVKKETPSTPKVERKEESTDDNLSWKDQQALLKADVHEDDLDEVVEFARFKKIPVADVLKTSAIKTILAEKAEFRKTADATNGGKPKRVLSKVTDETLQQNLSKGDVPAAGSKEAEDLFWARRGGRR